MPEPDARIPVDQVPEHDTRTKLLDTAERLFARYGVQGVSARTILSESGASVAMVHYHFGGRDGLIHEVLLRRLEPLNRKRLDLLEHALESARPHHAGVEAVLRAFFSPAVELLDEHPAFARLLGQLHMSPDPELRAFFRGTFEDVLRRFGDAIREALPVGLSPGQRVVRANFVLGAMVHTLNYHDEMAPPGTSDDDLPRGDDLLDEMVSFCAAGLNAT